MVWTNIGFNQAIQYSIFSISTWYICSLHGPRFMALPFFVDGFSPTFFTYINTEFLLSFPHVRPLNLICRYLAVRNTVVTLIQPPQEVPTHARCCYWASAWSWSRSTTTNIIEHLFDAREDRPLLGRCLLLPIVGSCRLWYDSDLMSGFTNMEYRSNIPTPTAYRHTFSWLILIWPKSEPIQCCFKLEFEMIQHEVRDRAQAVSLMICQDIWYNWSPQPSHRYLSRAQAL